MISVQTAQGDLQKLSEFAGVFQSVVQIVPSILGNISQLVPAGTPMAAIATEAETFVKAALVAEGHAIPVLEMVWNQAKPLLAAIFAVTGNEAAAAIINALPSAPVPAAAT